MVARRFVFMVVVLLCGLAWAFVLGPGFASAASQFGSYGQETEQFRQPKDVAVGATGDVYIADTANGVIDKFDSSGNFPFGVERWLRTSSWCGGR